MEERLSKKSKQLSGGEPSRAKILQNWCQNQKLIICKKKSHWHLDHLGDPATFPNSTTIIVGPGFKKEFFLDDDAKQPKEDSPIPSSFYADRTLREISELEFDLNIAGFSVFDYFGDGSFYLVNSPGVRFLSPNWPCKPPLTYI